MRTIQNYSDLTSSQTDTVNGFIWQATEKLNRSNQYFANAHYFLNNYIMPENNMMTDNIMRAFLLSACMLSNKSLGHLSITEQDAIIRNSIDFNSIYNNRIYREKLVYRYFLTCGDTLGGVMRNAIGQAAQNVLTSEIIDTLVGWGITPIEGRNRANKITRLSWEYNNLSKTIFFDQKPSFLGNSVDFVVTQGPINTPGSLHDINSINACGELKGGVDPAGADEHWKTARAALRRIEDMYTQNNLNPPELYFIGAAIENSMAREIFQDLQTGKLHGAANLMKPQQLREVVELIIR
ncbi:AvaI/BsoBI family type II restriction endonuclease [Faucicola atlantae]|uniref:Restriction endonuclease n=1 Tax=Faucicola atlantae TaxID=34059 RepID=A0A1B8QBY4_9GAMM|nr:AvaI/BsoBI family type II restriction endonuclease [Moraxella atlantae]OBX78205.1 hypothetical protein A9306_09715 [Moraxella atlantae]